MGYKIIPLLVLLAFTSGCSTFFVKGTKVQYVPILYCPDPPTVVRPELPIHKMTPVQKQNAGEVVKHYKATVRSLMGYSEDLESIIRYYNEADKEYEELRLKLEEEINSGVFAPTKIPPSE